MQRALMELFGGAALAAMLIIAAGPPAMAQKYPDMQGPRAYDAGQAYRGGYTVYPNGIWNGQVYDSPKPDSSHSSFGSFSSGVAREQLNAKGYSQVHGLEREHGWSGHAIKNGRQAHVFLDDKNKVATYRGD
ncbi:MAG TPA: hypothetical protein VFX06_17130 [Stellaceae bacterium]|nr:hypothetical protein [Stellaceae bacterium]